MRDFNVLWTSFPPIADEINGFRLPDLTLNKSKQNGEGCIFILGEYGNITLQKQLKRCKVILIELQESIQVTSEPTIF